MDVSNEPIIPDKVNHYSLALKSKTDVNFCRNQHADMLFSADLNKHTWTIPRSLQSQSGGLPCAGSFRVSAHRAGVVWGLCGHGPLERHKYVLRSPLLQRSAVSSLLSQETRG